MTRHQAIHREECNWKSHKTTSTAGHVSTCTKCFCRFWTRCSAIVTVWLPSREQNLKYYAIPPSYGSIISMMMMMIRRICRCIRSSSCQQQASGAQYKMEGTSSPTHRLWIRCCGCSICPLLRYTGYLFRLLHSTFPVDHSGFELICQKDLKTFHAATQLQKTWYVLYQIPQRSVLQCALITGTGNRS